MESSDYVTALCEFLHADGWETDTPQVDDGIVIITAAQQSTEGDKSIAVLVVTPAEGQLRPAHLAQLRETIRNQRSDGAVVTAERGLREEVHQCAEQYDRIRALDPATVAASVGGLSPATNRPGGLTRRRLLAGGVLAGGGLVSAGLLFRPGRGSEREPEPAPESIPYAALRTNTDQYVGSKVFYFPTRIAEVIESSADTQLLRIQLRYTPNGWHDDVIGRWDGEPYGENYFIQFTGRVAGTYSYETESGGDRTLPEISIEESKEI